MCAAGWLCSEPSCRQAAALPLQHMLSGQLPGYVEHGELLLQVSVAALPASAGQPAVGPLGEEARTFSGPLLRWGYEAASQGLWGRVGFRSRRLPSTSGEAVGRQLEAVRAARFQSAPWVEQWMQRFQEQLAAVAAGTWQPPKPPAASTAPAQRKSALNRRGRVPAAAIAWVQTAGLVLLVCLLLVLLLALPGELELRRAKLHATWVAA